MITQDPTTETGRGFSLEELRAFMKLPIEQRRRFMEEQSINAARHYKSDSETAERQEWQGGDIVEI